MKNRLPRPCLALLAATLLAGVAAAQIVAPRGAPRPKLPPVQTVAAAMATAAPAPLAGLDAAALADFAAGLAEFVAVETPEGGLGPTFNDSSCVACHSAGGVGGASARTVTRFGRRGADGRFDPLTALGGSLLQARAVHPSLLERVPLQANVSALRVATPLFGAGLIEAIADEDILLGERRPQPDGVRGRALRVTDVASGTPRVGRFGWKAQHATLLAFAADAYVNEMGVTNRFFPQENAPNGRSAALAPFVTAGVVEDQADPATGKADIDHAADFMRLLAPLPAPRPTASSLAGARLFEQARCTACHVPVMFTGANANPALAHQPVRLYSDLLLHDMGRLGDGIEQDGAGAREMRTAPLWGLRMRPSFLHDGRARTLPQAVQAHDGEGAAARDRYNALRPAEQQQLIDFLRSI